MYCIETIDLVHKFSEDEIALNFINLQVIESTIYGFLGPRRGKNDDAEIDSRIAQTTARRDFCFRKTV